MKGGCGGKRGRKRCFSEAVGGVPARKIASPRRDLAEAGGFTAKFIFGEHSFPFRFAKNYFGRIILATVVF